MGAIIVVVTAVVVMLVAGVVVAVVRLLGALRQLRSAVEHTQQWVQPVIDELTENSQVASLEAAQLQASVDELRTARKGH